MFGKALLVMVVMAMVAAAPIPSFLDSHISKTLHPATGSASKGFVIEIDVVVREEGSQDTEEMVKTESVTEDKNQAHEDKEATATSEDEKKFDEEDQPYTRKAPMVNIKAEDIKAKAGKSAKDHMKPEGDAIKPGKLTRDKAHTKDATTLDPLTEFCKEACAAGVGGPECDCPDHPIG